MPSLLFHQNMASFGGANALRNAAFQKSFLSIHAGLPAGHVIDVAGFTEIANNVTAPGSLGSLAASLMGLPAGHAPSLYTVACGRADLSAGREYISIAVRPGWETYAVGRLLFQESGRRVTLLHDSSPTVPPEPDWANRVPARAAPDYRGLVYVLITNGQVKVAVGYLHNRYLNPSIRERVRQQTERMLHVLEQHPRGAPDSCYIGGDFNLPPGKVGRATHGRAFAYGLGPTTMGGNTYDYWYCRVNPFMPVGLHPGFIVPVPSLSAATVGLTQSDHAACLLRVS
jgi:hypothetical protein